MANRYYVRNTMSLEKNPIALYLKVNIGASGAPTLVSKQCLGVYLMARQSAGLYKISLGVSSQSKDSYQRLLALQASVLNSTIDPILQAQVTSDSSANISDPHVIVQFLDAAGAAADPANGSVLLIKLELSNSSAI